MSGKEKDSNVNADDIPANLRGVVQSLNEIVNCSEQEIYAMLIECNMDTDEAVNRLLSQDGFQKVKSKRDKKKEKYTSDSLSQGVYSSIKGETSNVQGTCKQLPPSSPASGIIGPHKSDLANDETESVPISSVEAGPSLSVPSSSGLTNDETKSLPISSVEAGPSLSVPSSSDLTNGETKSVPVNSDEGGPSVSLPSSQYQPNWGCSTSRRRTMADVVMMGLDLSKESVTKASFKDYDGFSYFSKSPIESFARRDQLQESGLISNQNLCNDHVTYHPFSNSCMESSAIRDQLQESALVSNQNFNNEDVTDPFSNSFIESDAIRNDDDYGDSLLPLFLRRHQSTTNDELCEEQIAHQTQLNATSNHLETDPVQKETHGPAPAEPSLQMQNVNQSTPAKQSITTASSSASSPSISMTEIKTEPMQYETHAQAPAPAPAPSRPSLQMNQPMPTKQSITTASSSTRRPSISMTDALKTAKTFVPQIKTEPVQYETQSPAPAPAQAWAPSEPTFVPQMNQQAMNQQYYPQPNVPIGHYGNMMYSPYTLQNQSMSPFQQHGGNNNNTYYPQPPPLMLPHYINSDFPQPVYAIVPPPYYGPPYAANSMFLSSQFNGNNLFPSVQPQQSPSLGHSQQQPRPRPPGQQQ